MLLKYSGRCSQMVKPYYTPFPENGKENIWVFVSFYLYGAEHLLDYHEGRKTIHGKALSSRKALSDVWDGTPKC